MVNTPIKYWNSIPEMFLDTCAENEDHIALRYIEDDEIHEITYGKYRTYVLDVAAGLMKRGIEPDTNIAILSETRYEWVIADLAIMSVGCHTVAIFPTLDVKQVDFEIRDSDSEAVFVSTQEQLQKLLRTETAGGEKNTIKSIIIMDRCINKNQMKQSDPRIIEFHQLKLLGEKARHRQPEVVEERIHQIKPEDLASIIYTSGTTGIPKGVMLSHKNQISDIMLCSIALPPFDDEVSTTFLPLSHSFAHTIEHLGCCYTGSTLCFARNYELLPKDIQIYKPTGMVVVPYMLEQTVKKIKETARKKGAKAYAIFQKAIDTGKEIYEIERRGDSPPLLLRFKGWFYRKVILSAVKKGMGGNLRRLVSGGAPLDPEIGKFFWAAGIHVLHGYGLTEAAPVTHVNRDTDTIETRPSTKFETVGPIIGWDLDGTECPYGSVEHKIADNGELLIRGPNVMMGYYKKPKETTEAIDKEGWLHTGDIASVDPDGYVKIVGRIKQILVLNTGKKVSPAKVEQIYKSSPYIEQIMVIGDGRNFITALIVPELDKLHEELNLDEENLNDEKLNRPEIRSFYKRELENRQQDELSHHETVKKFRLLSEAFTEENGLLNPAMKKLREKIYEKYANCIENFY